MSNESFFQELSVLQVFRKEKYFVKLLCYSQNPNQIVLKYYRYGSLFNFIYSPNNDVPVPYSIELSLHLASRIIEAINLMHKKGYIHNDLKSANFLLDGDTNEPLYPVITDFGIVQILDSANIANGFKIRNLKAGTPDYCAPEVLISFRNNEMIFNYKTDIYSFGIILIELFTRSRPWKNYNRDAVIQGRFPDISVIKILNNYPMISKTVAVEILRLILLCIEFDPGKRPSSRNIIDNLIEIKRNSEIRIKPLDK
jgi:serine/threonine protein kinase